LTYKLKTDVILLSVLIQDLSKEKEFFIQKAIGWSLRQYARVDGVWVRDFVLSHELAPLSRREALKHL
jgi:3-methyladenine DNA glycosylase AlkD